MTSNNDYKTPKDRISTEFRNKLFAEEDLPVGAFFGMGGYAPSHHRENLGTACRWEGSERSRPREACETKGRRYAESGAPLAMVYSPFQKFEGLYTEEEALCKGSLFKGLYLPFEAYCCGRKEYGKMGGCKK